MKKEGERSAFSLFFQLSALMMLWYLLMSEPPFHVIKPPLQPVYQAAPVQTAAAPAPRPAAPQPFAAAPVQPFARVPAAETAQPVPAAEPVVQPAAKASTVKVETIATRERAKEMPVRAIPPGALKPRSMPGSFLRKIMWERFIIA